ncbi:MAG: FecR domain-containing protein [Nitrospirae bacterium]|nr:FecR domain-containing protein [Nitrospirota bacterium]
MRYKSLFAIIVFVLLTSINVNADPLEPPYVSASQESPSISASQEPANVNASLGPGHISFTQGDVQIRSQGGDKWFPAAVNTPVLKGDSLWVPKGGRLELLLPSGVYVRVDSNTYVDIRAMNDKDAGIYLAAGKVYVYFRPYEAYSLEISTPTIAVRSDYSSDFMMNVDQTGVTNVKVTRGEVYTEDKTSRRTLTAVTSARDSLNEWEAWNLERNATLALSASEVSYVPDTLRACAPGLGQYGRWVHTDHYGDVWTPTVSVGVEWSPYRVGKWAWIGNDYVWISYEPWGWMPYHYGRWTYDAAFGWGWIPPVAASVVWGPGFVGWVNTSEYVAWFPLGPADVYYGHGYYGPGSVNIASLSVNFRNVDYRYRNFYARAGLTTVAVVSFNSGNYRPSAHNPNAFRAFAGRNALTAQNVRFGRPNISNSGAMAARMPVIRNIPHSALPPSRYASVSPMTRGPVSHGSAMLGSRMSHGSTMSGSTMSHGNSMSGINPANRGINTSHAPTIGPHGQAGQSASQAHPLTPQAQTRKANIAGNSINQRTSHSQASMGFNTPKATQHYNQGASQRYYNSASRGHASTGYNTPGASQHYNQGASQRYHNSASQGQASTGYNTPGASQHYNQGASQRYHNSASQHQPSIGSYAPQAPQGHQAHQERQAPQAPQGHQAPQEHQAPQAPQGRQAPQAPQGHQGHRAH